MSHQNSATSNNQKLSDEQISYLRSSMHYTITECSSRGLLHSSKWLGEQLIGLPVPSSSSSSSIGKSTQIKPNFEEYEITSPISALLRNNNNNSINNRSKNNNNHSMNNNEGDDGIDMEEWIMQDKFLFAKSLFDLKEYDRCVHILSSISALHHHHHHQNMDNNTGGDESNHFHHRNMSSMNLLKDENALLRLKNSNLNRKVLFLSLYSRYLSGEQSKERHKLEQRAVKIASQSNAGVGIGVTVINGTHGGAANPKLTGFGAKSVVENSKNAKLLHLSNELTTLHERTMRQSTGGLVQMDAYLFYLFAIVLKELKATQKAIFMLVESVVRNPLLWSAWHEIVTILQTNITTSNSVMSQNGGVSNHQAPVTISPMEVFHLLNQKYKQLNPVDSQKKTVFIVVRELFRAKLQIEASFSQTGVQNQTGINDSESAPATTSTFEQVAQSLIAIKNQAMPNSLYIICELALTNYHLQRFDKALELFMLIRKHDPYRYEHMHTFSNIYYIRGMKQELSVLGHELHKTHKYKPETCCVLGNYYSMRGEHERAVIYFKRALQLNPSFLSAWTLMGHEYVEMKNTTAAVSAYRTAVDIQPRDYRAWYGLGQTYEILSMPHYALYYYSKACALRPYDGRMWSALAGCYETLEQYRDALRCYQRSRENGEQVKSLVKMGELYRKMGDNAQAAHFYTKCINLQQSERDHVILGDEIEASILLFLTKYHMREAKPPDYEQAKIQCLMLLQQYPTYSQKEQAAQLLKEIQMLSSMKP